MYWIKTYKASIKAKGKSGKINYDYNCWLKERQNKKTVT